MAADLAVRAEDRLAKRKAELQRRASHANPPRPTVDAALSDAASDHELDMAARLLKAQALDATDAHRLAVRLLRPLSGDSAEPREVVQSALQTDDPIRLEAAVAGWIDSLPDLLVHDLRILRSAAHWLEKNARVQVGDITDPQHDDAPEAGHDEDSEDGDHDHALDAVHEDLSEQLTETLEAVAAEGAEEQRWPVMKV